ncbi:hypothetical protein AR687_24555 [Flavobacteriaceae bacterium CRH]|nr:hypothetical protein AR687_24555 [Flavobacteriaceae bacterium CRH]
MNLSIHPSVGVSRLGNSIESKFYLSPDSIGGLPYDTDLYGNKLGPIVNFKDQSGAIKRQGQVFTVYDDKNNEITIDSPGISSIEWYVHLNNNSKWNGLLQESKFIKDRTKGFNINEMNLWVRSAHTHILDLSNTKKFLAVRDAMASYDPISSMVIGFAFSSACTVAAITVLELCDHDPQRISVYQNDVNLIFENYWAEHKKVYQQEKRWQNSEFWSRRN